MTNRNRDKPYLLFREATQAFRISPVAGAEVSGLSLSRQPTPSGLGTASETGRSFSESIEKRE